MLQTKTNYNTLFIIIKADHCSAPFIVVTIRVSIVIVWYMQGD